MTTPLGGPSQIVVKCRNWDGTGGNNIVRGDAVELVGHVYDTDQGEPILYAKKAPSSSSGKFLGIALSDAPKGLSANPDAGDGSGTGAGDYFHVCVFGLVQAKVTTIGSGAIVPGEAVVAGLQPTLMGAGSAGVLGDTAGSGSNTVVGIALETGKWSSVATADDLTWVFINGIQPSASFGGT